MQHMSGTDTSEYSSSGTLLWNERGIVLAVGVMFLGILAAMGGAAALMTRINIKSSGNYKNSEHAFYAAQGGTEHAREALRVINAASADVRSFSDEMVNVSGPDGLLQGYGNGSDDLPIVNAVLGDSTYSVYLTNDPADGVQNPTDTNRKVNLTSVALGPNGTRTVIEATVATLGLFPLPATITLLGPGASFTGGQSNAKELHGDDQCGADPPLPVVAISHVADVPALQASINGSKPHTYHTLDNYGLSVTAESHPDMISQAIPAGTLLLIKNNYGVDLLDPDDLNRLVKSIQKVATTVAPGGSSATSVDIGSPGDPKAVVVTGDFTMNGSGAGILVVTGNLTFNGNVDYDGLILVIGQGVMQRNGAGNGTLNGGIVVANTAGPDGVPGNADDVTGAPLLDTSGGGNGNVHYCSTVIDNMTSSLPLRILAFKQMY